jgi:cyanate lyase
MARGVSNSDLAAKIGKRVEPVHMKHYGQEQLSIIRQSSLKAAVQLSEAILPRLDIQFSVNDVREFTLETAEIFEKWVTRNETGDSSDK